jgi:hypothetical protein
LGTRLKGKAHEWFYRHIEHCDRAVRDWTLEAAIHGLQCRFLHTLTHHNASNRFDSVIQSQRTVHKLLNDLKKHAGRMIMQPDAYTFRKRFVVALHKPLRNEVLKRGFNAEFSTIKQLYKTACMLEEATRYHHGMCHPENVQSTSSQPYKSVTYRPAGLVTAISRPVPQVRVAPTLPAHSRTVSAPRPEPWTTGSGLNPNNYPQWGNTSDPQTQVAMEQTTLCATNVASQVTCVLIAPN